MLPWVYTRDFFLWDETLPTFTIRSGLNLHWTGHVSNLGLTECQNSEINWDILTYQQAPKMSEACLTWHKKAGEWEVSIYAGEWEVSIYVLVHCQLFMWIMKNLWFSTRISSPRVHFQVLFEVSTRMEKNTLPAFLVDSTRGVGLETTIDGMRTLTLLESKGVVGAPARVAPSEFRKLS